MDPLTPLLSQTSLAAKVFFTGELCQLATFDETKLVGHIHVMKSGRVAVTVRGNETVIIDRPSILFFPRPYMHTLLPADEHGCELVCAFVDIGIKVRSPLAMSLPRNAYIANGRNENYCCYFGFDVRGSI